MTISDQLFACEAEQMYRLLHDFVSFPVATEFLLQWLYLVHNTANLTMALQN